MIIYENRYDCDFVRIGNVEVGDEFFANDSKLEPVAEERDGDAYVWTFPYRDTSQVRLLGFGLLMFGLALALFMLFWISTPVFWGIQHLQNNQDWFGIALLLFSLPGFYGLLQASRMVMGGIMIIQSKTRATIRYENEKLIGIENLGWFSFRKKLKLDDVHCLEVNRPDSNSEGGRVRQNQMKSLFSSTDKIEYELIAVRRDGERVTLSSFYTEEIFEKVANRISQVAQISVTSKQKEDQNRNAPIDRTNDLDVEESEAVLQTTLPVSSKGEKTEPILPSGSKIITHETGDGTSFEVLPTGFKGVALFFTIFGSIWTLIAVSILAAGVQGQGNDMIFGLLVLPIFILVGVGFLLVGVNTARTKRIIGVFGDQIFVEVKSLFRNKFSEFHKSEIICFEVGDSGVEINDRPVQELKCVRNDGKSEGILSGPSDSELHWLVFQINNLLGISPGKVDDEALWTRFVPSAGQESSEITDTQPPSDRIEVIYPKNSNRSGGQTTIYLKQKSIFYRALSLIPFVIMTAILTTIIFFVGFREFIPFLMLSFFQIIVFCIFAVSIVIGSFRFEISVQSDQLQIKRMGLVGNYDYFWQLKDLRSVNLTDTGMKTNNQIVWSLAVEGNPNLSLMMYWKAEEIAYVAGILNHSLMLENKKKDDSPNGQSS